MEDETDILKLCTFILQEMGHEVLAAESAALAIEIATNSTEPINLLISDVIMPGMNGFELYQQLCRTQPLRCLLISGYTADLMPHDGILPENVAFLQKPFTVNQFEEAVNKQLHFTPAAL